MRSDWWSCDGRGSTGAAPHAVPNERLTRRSVLMAAGLGAVAWASRSKALAQVSLRTGRDAADGNALVVIFLRGGADGLSLVPPHAEDAYYALRPTLAIARPNDRRASSEDRAIDLDGFFGLHPALSALRPAYDAGDLALVQAAGSNDETRSHFEAMNTMERGLAQQRSGDAAGWLARHLASAPASDPSPLRAVAFSSTMPDSLRGGTGAIALQSLTEFQLKADASEDLRRELAGFYAKGDDEMTAAGRETLKVLDALNRLDPATYRAANGATYPQSDLGKALKEVAFLVKSGLGLEVAALDKGGWDTHVAQGRGTGWLASLLDDLGRSLAAFRQDLGAQMRTVTVIVQTEFGRRAYENAGLGTDHGHAGAMFVLGGGVQGGKVFGHWPGLAKDQLVEPGDLAVTTDYRDVLAEALAKRLGNARSSEVFPGLAAKPVGVFS